MNKSQQKRSRTKKEAATRIRETTSGSPISEGIQLTKNALIGAGIAVAFAFLLLLLTTAMILRAKDPQAWIAPTAIGTLYLTAMIAGATTRHFQRRSPIACGLLAGVILLLFGIVLSLFLPRDAQTAEGYWWIRLAAPLFAVMGSYIGHLRPRKQRKKRR